MKSTRNNTHKHYIIRKNNSIQNLNFEHSLKRIRKGISAVPNELLRTEPTTCYNTYKNLPLMNFISKNKYLRAKTPKRDIFPKKYLNLEDNNLTFNSSYKRLNKNAISEIKNNINYDGIYNININDYSNRKEIIMLNKILKNQNKEFIFKTSEMRNKINELLNNLKSVRLENKKINNDKKKLISKISYLEKELNINKNMSLKEIELKNNTIEQLNSQILKMNFLLDEKEKDIFTLTNEINNIKGNSNNNYDINELNLNIDKVNNNKNINPKGNINNLLNTINVLKNKLKDYEKIKNYLKEVENQKKSYENLVNDLSQQLNFLKNENNILKSSSNTSNNQNKIKLLLEENKNLYNQIQILSNNSINNNDIYISKNNFEGKSNEVNDCNKKIKNLMNQINIYKNNKDDLMKKNKDLKEEVDQLKTKVSNLENENLNNQQQIFELSNLNNILQIRVNSVHSGNFKLNAFGRKDNKPELEQKIQSLKQKNEELKEQLKYLSKGNNLNIAKIIEEKQKLANENLDLKNELLILRNQINENDNNIYNLNDNINIFEKENKMNEIKNKLEDMKIKYELNLNKLKENEIDNIRNINNKLIEENKELKKQQNNNNNIILYHPEEKERNSITIDNLKEELKDKNLQIEKLIKENNNLKNNNINIKNEDYNNIDLNEDDKNKIYIDQIKELKVMNESDLIQIKALKADIKEMKEKMKKMETFSGQLKDFDEFISLLNNALFNYRPKKKEQKEALNKLIEVMNNHRI